MAVQHDKPGFLEIPDIIMWYLHEARFALLWKIPPNYEFPNTICCKTASNLAATSIPEYQDW